MFPKTYCEIRRARQNSLHQIPSCVPKHKKSYGLFLGDLSITTKIRSYQALSTRVQILNIFGFEHYVMVSGNDSTLLW
jgi:hypothetical protein